MHSQIDLRHYINMCNKMKGDPDVDYCICEIHVQCQELFRNCFYYVHIGTIFSVRKLLIMTSHCLTGMSAAIFKSTITLTN